MKTIFTQIIERTIPSTIVYETDYVLAFLDIHPEAPGHILLIPKVQTDRFDEVPEPYYSALWEVAKILTNGLITVCNSERVFLKIIGTDVPHCHLHLIPYYGEGVTKQGLSPTEKDAFANELRQFLNR